MPERSTTWRSVANDLKSAREARGLTQRDLARRMGRAPPRVSELESGDGDPRISTVLAAATALGMELVVVPTAKARELKRLAAGGRGRAKPPTVLEEVLVPDEDADG